VSFEERGDGQHVDIRALLAEGGLAVAADFGSEAAARLLDKDVSAQLDPLLQAYSQIYARATSGSRPRARFAARCQLPDGAIGYAMRRYDDCWQAAVATVIQVDVDEVPDAHADARLAAGETPEQAEQSAGREFDEWLAARSLLARVHKSVPVNADRWLGIVPRPGWAQGHCLVMAHDDLLFDPARAIGALDQSRRVRIWGPDDVAVGVTFASVPTHMRGEKV
jgi:hypothetical protein